ncbi:uncharacterized protein SAPINGB_P005635 [Magnusiomyces paraingens]|uniref:Porphobilinogen deaminase n=1 Tax=Magnusiomyces paraingens TaxID=2606893 RepID=A0A5E8C084_9ASCO|nr:uncharacterized protein SAPINGB_P005635 [Saprochaete ingens]VVT57279.1 unnamed protein product [Saprochaete ingens]
MSFTQVSPPAIFLQSLTNTAGEHQNQMFISKTSMLSPKMEPQILSKTSIKSAQKPSTNNDTSKSDSPEKDSNIVFYDDYTRCDVSSENIITVGGRKSILAVVQSKCIASELHTACPLHSFPVVALSTLGDLVQGKPLYSFGGKSLWTKELETLMLGQYENLPKIDIIVHSLKDMPTALPEGCILGAITEREDPRDAVVMKASSPYVHLRDLPHGSVVGTSSIRRSAQLKKNFPHLVFESVRGNVQTRLRKLDDPSSKFSCIILAVAGLNRLGLGHRITSCLDAPDMYYAVGQGALGIEIRSSDEKVKELLEKISHKETYLKCLAERSLLRTLEGGCSVPIGVKTSFISPGNLEFTGIVVSVDGTEYVNETVTGKVTTDKEANELGELLAKRLIENGAKKILDQIHLDQIK